MNNQVDLSKFFSRKLVAFAVVTALFVNGMVDAELFQSVLWVYIGGQAVVDAVKEWKK